MTPFMTGFSDELEKLAGPLGALARAGGWAIKRPFTRILAPATIGYTGFAGARAASKEKHKKRIQATPGRPSRAWFTDYHRALGLPRRLTKLQKERLSRHFAKYREK